MVKPTLINDVSFIRNKLVELRVHRSLNSLSELIDCEIEKEHWEYLTYLDCSSNNIPEIDESMVSLFSLSIFGTFNLTAILFLS